LTKKLLPVCIQSTLHDVEQLAQTLTWASVNYRKTRGQRHPLQEAIERGYHESVRLLATAENIGWIGDSGSDALDTCASQGELALLRLFSAVVPPSAFVLHIAAQHDHLDVVKWCIDQRMPGLWERGDGDTVLERAVAGDAKRVVHLLQEHCCAGTGPVLARAVSGEMATLLIMAGHCVKEAWDFGMERFGLRDLRRLYAVLSHPPRVVPHVPFPLLRAELSGFHAVQFEQFHGWVASLMRGEPLLHFDMLPRWHQVCLLDAVLFLCLRQIGGDLYNLVASFLKGSWCVSWSEYWQ
jgi:hypothetical protein